MTITTSKISSKNQIVVPQQIRKLLGVGSGDTLVWKTSKERIELLPQGKTFAHYTRGLGKKAWKGMHTTSYIQKLRDEWN